MKSQQAFLRRTFAPLSVGCSLECSTNASPLAQVFQNGTYIPDRSATPTVITPIVTCSTTDGSWDKPTRANSYISNIVWKVNGVDINEAWAKSEFEIKQTNDDIKGRLLIRKNIAPDTQISLSFSATISDERNNNIVRVESQEISLFTNAAADDEITVESEFPPSLTYSSAHDMLLLKDYMLAHGMKKEAQTLTPNDSNVYLLTRKITVRKGNEVLSKGFTLEVKRLLETENRTEEENPGTEYLGVENGNMTFDLRLIASRTTYIVNVKIDGKTICKRTLFRLDRQHPPVDIKPCNEANIYPGTVELFQQAIATINGKELKCPESTIKMVLKADTAYQRDITLGEGNNIRFRLEDLNIGGSHSDGYINTYYEYDHKDEFVCAIDEDNNQFTNEEGDILIIQKEPF